jgi:hypothetical protein
LKWLVRIFATIVQPAACFLPLCVTDDLHCRAVGPQFIRYDDMWSSRRPAVSPRAIPRFRYFGRYIRTSFNRSVLLQNPQDASGVFAPFGKRWRNGKPSGNPAGWVYLYRFVHRNSACLAVLYVADSPFFEVLLTGWCRCARVCRPRLPERAWRPDRSWRFFVGWAFCAPSGLTAVTTLEGRNLEDSVSSQCGLGGQNAHPTACFRGSRPRRRVHNLHIAKVGHGLAIEAVGAVGKLPTLRLALSNCLRYFLL